MLRYENTVLSFFETTMANNLVEEFPVWALLPKKETGVTNFLNKYPEFDGRGVTIAIFDSGVDPGAPGLQITSEGKPKIIERFDCSGAGDVDTSKVVQAVDGIIEGITGRTLQIPSTWENPKGDYHIGIKNAFELFPSKLRERVQQERKEKFWDSQHKMALAEASRALQEFETAHTGGNLSPADKLKKEDLEAQVELLTSYEKKYTDCGPAYDCVVFYDGKIWQACIDTSESGKLDEGVLLGEYSQTKKFTHLTELDQFSISVNVHDNGNVLEIVGMCSGHGTHVASIASAYFPDEPERNGVAPGAQIVSCTIGDARLGSMETGTSLVRAMIKVMQMSSDGKLHIINMSYGEHAHWSNTGRIYDLISEVVNKYGIVWVVSAGNHGPALCTVGTPPDYSQNCCIGVGAYVSPEMMAAEYSLRQKMPGMPYTWSSRGPTLDGDIGVTITAPGAAITSVPNFTLRSSQLMNGTSMSSPHVAGAVGLLLSGAMQSKVPYSPYSVKRALENSANYLDEIEPFVQGCGLLQIEQAFEHLVANHNNIERDVRFSISCSGNGTKGIHIRGGDTDRVKDVTIMVEPFFLDRDTVPASAKINFELRLALTCKATYVQYPAHLDLTNMLRTFSVRIDPSELTEGAHYTSVDAYDASNVSKGVVFRIPITVVKPLKLDLSENSSLKPAVEWDCVTYQQNTIKRHFVVVPELATWAVLSLKSLDKDKSARFMVHCMQVMPKHSCKTLESQRLWNVVSQTEVFHGFKVQAGLVLEVAIAKYWANQGKVNMKYALSFYGLKPNDPDITMHSADGLKIVQIRSLRFDEIAPTVTLKSSVQSIRPNDSKVNPLSVRDIILPGRQIYELLLTYSFHVAKATEVTPNCALLSDLLYESEFESQLWYIYDSNKQVMAVGDAYPQKYVAKLEKGDYTLKLQVRHDKKDLLEKYTDMPILISQKLIAPITLDIYSNYSQAMVGGKKLVYGMVSRCTILPIYISAAISDKQSKTTSLGQFLSGTITYAKDDIGRKIDIYPFKYILSEQSKKNGKANGTGNSDKEKNKFEEFTDALRDLKVSWLSKLEGSEEAYELYEELKSDYPEHYAVHISMLQSIDPLDVKKQVPVLNEATDLSEQNLELINKVDQITSEILNIINQDKLLAFYGIKSDNRQEASKIKSEMEKMKSALCEALTRKGISLCRKYFMASGVKEEQQQIQDQISNVWSDLLKFVEPTDLKVIFFSMWHATVYNHFGRLLKYMHRYLEEKPSLELEVRMVYVFLKLKWAHCVRHISFALPTKYPTSYRPF